LKERDIFEGFDVDGRLTFKWVLKKWYVKILTEFVWLGIGISGRLL
jgi:hypothetical protein